MINPDELQQLSMSVSHDLYYHPPIVVVGEKDKLQTQMSWIIFLKIPELYKTEKKCQHILGILVSEKI